MSTFTSDSQLACRPVTDSSRLSSAGRRELVWKSSDKRLNLSTISQQLEDFLFRLKTAASAEAIRRFPAREQAQTHHRCPGYCREEVFLGTKARSSTILSYSAPSPHEACTVCGETVIDRDWFRCPCGREDGSEATTNCKICKFRHHVGCPCGHAGHRVSYLCPVSHCGQVFQRIKSLRDHLGWNHTLKSALRRTKFTLDLQQPILGSSLHQYQRQDTIGRRSAGPRLMVATKFHGIAWT
ncbi:hypothetical protein C8R44DRAFT_342170 [Mycena epipterygia]|nr:hypothetical protein C8R44DRAFT_342170 [Mycena epipterygia]